MKVNNNEATVTVIGHVEDEDGVHVGMHTKKVVFKNEQSLMNWFASLHEGAFYNNGKSFEILAIEDMVADGHDASEVIVPTYMNEVVDDSDSKDEETIRNAHQALQNQLDNEDTSKDDWS